jgi:putative ABC transport system permease protein
LEENVFSSVYFFILISVFILIIAWVNYINLCTARAIERAKEVGIKKAMGVARAQLISQFLTESMLTNFIAIVMAVILAINLLPLLSDVVGKHLSFDFTRPRLWVVLLLLFFSGSIVSGIYPAFILSSFKTVDVIKSRIGVADTLSFRKALIVFQFSASLLLTVGTWTIYRQIHFMQEHEKGMNMEQMLIVNGSRVFSENEQARLTAFKNKLLSNAFVESVTSSGTTPGNGYSLNTGMWRMGSEVKTNRIETIHIVQTDYDFIDTYDIKMIAGRTWNPEMGTHQNAVLINEAALRPFELGDPHHALSEKLIIDGQDTVAVLGVFKNAHWNSLHMANEPLLLSPQKISSGQFSIRVKGNIHESVSQIGQIYKDIFPENPFSYYFLDDFFDRQYRADQQFAKIVGIFSVLAIAIACLGLWGLASFTALQRMKEISIRKVLGASVSHVITLLSNQYIRLILISGVIALPVSALVISQWLNNYAFRINLSWDLFALPLFLLGVIAIIAVSTQTIKAALSNPVTHLKNE